MTGDRAAWQGSAHVEAISGGDRWQTPFRARAEPGRWLAYSRSQPDPRQLSAGTDHVQRSTPTRGRRERRRASHRQGRLPLRFRDARELPDDVQAGGRRQRAGVRRRLRTTTATTRSPSRPANKDIVTPNNDTPYSWAWLDLRAEPWVLSVPAVPKDRYYVCQWFDLFTHNFAYVGVRAHRVRRRQLPVRRSALAGRRPARHHAGLPHRRPTSSAR